MPLIVWLAACGDGDSPVAGAAAPTVSLSASATAVTAGGSTTLTWSSTNATSCAASGGWSGPKPTSGSEVRSNLTAASSFTLTCTGSGGSASQSVTVAVSGAGAPPPPTPPASGMVLFDDFEYDVARDATDAEVAFRARGWTDVKANNSHFRRGSGYIYTRFDPARNSRVLVLEALPSTAPVPPGFPYSQTDFWIKYGGEDTPLTTVPANVWFQFWIYATPESRFHRSKFIYPCRSFYPCTSQQTNGITNFAWLFGWHYVTGPDESRPIQAPEGGWFWSFRAPLANNRAVPEYNRDKLYQNLDTTPLLAGRWYQVRMHVDTSGPQGAYELWIRETGQPWLKVAEWIGGVTPNFDWPIPEIERVGNRVFAMPTTVNAVDSTLYLDDFAMATSEAALPAQ